MAARINVILDGGGNVVEMWVNPETAELRKEELGGGHIIVRAKLMDEVLISVGRTTILGHENLDNKPSARLQGQNVTL